MSDHNQPRTTTGGNDSNADLPSQAPGIPIMVPPEGVNLEQVPTTDPDVLFRGAFGTAIPQFSVTIDRTNIGPSGDSSPNGEPVFNFSNIPPFLRDMIESVMQQQGPNLDTQKRATEDAIEHLTVVDPKDLVETERTCPICYDPFDIPVKPDGKKSAKEDELKRKKAIKERAQVIDSDPGMWFPVDATARTHVEYSLHSKGSLFMGSKKEEEEEELKQPEHIPVQMPCKHVFGRSCLTEWLKSNVSCPLCRREVESQPLGASSSSSSTAETRAQSLIINRSFCPADWSTTEHTNEDPAIPIPIASSARGRPLSGRPRRVIGLTQPFFTI